MASDPIALSSSSECVRTDPAEDAAHNSDEGSTAAEPLRGDGNLVMGTVKEEFYDPPPNVVGSSGEIGAADDEPWSGGLPTLTTGESLKEMYRFLGKPQGFQFMIPEEDERPWTPPPRFMCLHEAAFVSCGLRFPLPKQFVDFCAAREVAFTQLTGNSVLVITGLLDLGRELGIEIGVDFLEEATVMSSNAKNKPGTYYISLKGAHGVVLPKPSKVRDWERHYFYVEMNEHTLEDPTGRVFTNWGLGFAPYKSYTRPPPEDFGTNIARIREHSIALYPETFAIREKKRGDRAGKVGKKSKVGPISKRGRGRKTGSAGRLSKTKSDMGKIDRSKIPSFADLLSDDEPEDSPRSPAVVSGHGSDIVPVVGGGGKGLFAMSQMRKEREAGERVRPTGRGSESPRLVQGSRKRTAEAAELGSPGTEVLETAVGGDTATAGSGLLLLEQATEANPHAFRYEYSGTVPFTGDAFACADLFSRIQGTDSMIPRFDSLVAADAYKSASRAVAEAAAGVNSLTKFYDGSLREAWAEVESVRRTLGSAEAASEVHKSVAEAKSKEAEDLRSALEKEAARAQELEAALASAEAALASAKASEEKARENEKILLKELRSMHRGMDIAAAEIGHRERKIIGEAYAAKYAERFEKFRRHLAEKEEANKALIVFGGLQGTLELLDLIQSKDGVEIPEKRVQGLRAKMAKWEKRVDELDVVPIKDDDLTMSPVCTPSPGADYSDIPVVKDLSKDVPADDEPLQDYELM